MWGVGVRNIFKVFFFLFMLITDIQISGKEVPHSAQTPRPFVPPLPRTKKKKR
jgi:hypothetical protein